MKSYQSVCLLFIILCSTCSYGQAWKQYSDSAKIFQEQNKTDKAIEWYSKAIEELKKDSAGTKSYGITCENLAILYKNKALYGLAEPLFLETLQLKEKMFGKEDTGYAASCHQLAILYTVMGQYGKAEPLFFKAKQIQEKVLGKQHPDYAATCNYLALLYYDMGQYNKAESLVLESKQIREKVLGKQHLDYAGSCNNLALLYYTIGQYEKAEPLYLEAKQIKETLLGKEFPSYATSCINLAKLYLSLGDYSKAEPLYLEAKQTREKLLGKQHPEYAASCFNLGLFYLEMGQYSKAEPLLLEAKQIRQNVLGKEHPYYASSCQILAKFYCHINQYDKAEPLYQEAKQIWEKVYGKENQYYASSCLLLAGLYTFMEQYEKAEPLYQEARQFYERVLSKKVLEKQDPQYTSSCTKLALLYIRSEQYDKSAALLLEVNQILKKQLGNQHPAYGSSCALLANLYWLTHQPLKAEKRFEEYFSIIAYNLNTVFQFTNEKEKVAYIENVYSQDDNAYSFYLSEKIQSGQPYSLSLFHRNLVLFSSAALRKRLSTTKETNLITKYQDWVNLKKHLSILYAKPLNERKEDAVEMEEKAGKLEKELTRLSTVFAKQQQTVDWKDIQKKLKADEASIEFASFHKINSKQHADTVFYVAMLLRKNMTFPVTISLCTEKQLSGSLTSNNIETTRKVIQKLYTQPGINVDNKKNSAPLLYDLVWKPLEKELNGIKTIYFAPSGTLHKIAFAALQVTNKEVLSDRYKLIQLSTTASVADQQQTYITTSDKIQLYGGINYNVDSAMLKDVTLSYHVKNEINRSLTDDLTRSGGWNELPGTKKEIAGIVSLSGKYRPNITAHSGLNATEESLKALDGTASPAVLHIATHGFFFPDPKKDIKDQINFESGEAFKLSDDPLMRSGLLFTGANNAWQNKCVEGIDDGILTAYEVSNLYLPNTKLVVLSACETGLGEIHGSEGVYGLQRAFKIAGVQNLLMSLWKVPDPETAEYMEVFYKNLFAQQSISDAFYNTQKVMKNKYRFQPYKWAAWVLVR